MNINDAYKFVAVTQAIDSFVLSCRAEHERYTLDSKFLSSEHQYPDPVNTSTILERFEQTLAINGFELIPLRPDSKS